ncbi:enolase C-terminal domain-like protein [Clostridium sp. MCC353]|uniref:enolase C-terminal domain-like protein n=1 Tax=Clostridium sp. MCC353 TaxID=2592646 RepID=UPI001C00D370|nr:enolase C-terminal domain-like protein [Clostridium sp. MCC353]
MIYKIDGIIEQNIGMKINEGLAFPDKIRIKKAVLYSFNRKPREKVWKDGTGKVSRDWAFPNWMKIYDDEGCCGEGLVSPAVWQIFIPMMLEDGQARTNLEWRKLFYWKERAGAQFFGAMYQTEMLIYDLIARKHGVPLHWMLGADRDWCDVYKGGGSVLRTDTELVEELLEIKEAGFKGTKFKIGISDVERDVRRMELVRKALGDDFKIAVDGNQSWDAETCMEFVRAAHFYNIEWYEEPIQAQEMDEIGKFAMMMKEENIDVPIAMGESAKSFDTFKSYIRSGVKVLQPVPFFYTLAEALRVMEYGRSQGCRITSGQGYLPGVLAGTLMKEGELIEFHKPNQDYVEDYYCVHSELRDGKMYLPDIPGIPVRVDFEKLEKDGCLAGIQYFYG